MPPYKCGISGCGYLTKEGSYLCEGHQPGTVGLVNNIHFEKDNINPDHYKQGGLETIDILKAKMTPAQYEGFLLGNMIKYATRYQYKNGVEDVKKAKWYAEELIIYLESSLS
jgi:hypothetical protein